MKTWVGSDLHLGHSRIMEFCPVTRAPYNNDVTYMNEKMVLEWNHFVQDDDLVYILGDVAFLPAQQAVQYLTRMKGRKILIKGNHDRKLVNDPSFRGCFESMHDYLEIVYEGTKVCLFHYPIAEWNGQHKGSVMLHGHLHGNVSGMEKYRCRDMGMDATGKIVTSMKDAIADAMKGMIKGHH